MQKSPCLSALASLVFLIQTAAGGELPWLRVADDGKKFVAVGTGEQFTPWGFNYDHDGEGRLLEDYWHDEWPTVEEDFAEMKALGGNVVRIHLQFGKFMDAPDRPNVASLNQLARLVKLAETTGLYLDLTGLACYHKQDVPPWYDKLSEKKRWAAQATFWEAVAKVCAKSPAIFCYDLMNEPVVGGTKPHTDWLGPAFGDKHFVQRISLSSAGRAREEIATAWIEQLVTAIRRHDQRHMVTVGLVPWSLPREGLYSGFDPVVVSKKLDFIAVHIYPEQGKVDEAIKTLQGFAAVDKPVVIEEIFPLKCSADELEKFIDDSRKHATGWIGFYWGKTPEEYRKEKTFAAAATLAWLELFQNYRHVKR